MGISIWNNEAGIGRSTSLPPIGTLLLRPYGKRESRCHRQGCQPHDQTDAAVDVRTVHRAATRLVRARTTQARPARLCRLLVCSRLPHPVAVGSRSAVVNVHQLGTGHWTSSTQWPHRVERAPPGGQLVLGRAMPSGPLLSLPGGSGYPRNILMRCPALMEVIQLAGHHRSQSGGRAK